MFGLLEGGRGVVNVIISFVALYFYSKLGETVAGVTGIVIGGCILCFLGAVLTWFVVPDKINASTDKIQFKDVRQSTETSCRMDYCHYCFVLLQRLHWQHLSDPPI